MPRICFEHPEITKWYEMTDEGTSSFDLCNGCHPYEGIAAEDLNLTDQGYNGDPIPSSAKSEEFDGHPDIDDTNYTCEVCGCKLTSKNYY